MDGRLEFCLKITNWCNLCCPHCCENSCKTNSPDFMSLGKIGHYLYEIQTLLYDTSEHVVIGGGEAMAPYLFRNNNYIPTALNLIFDAGKIPTIKTNGLWAKQDKSRKAILKDLAKIAYSADKLVTLDISVDEFHDNIVIVADLFAEILSNDFIMNGIRPCLVGFDTEGSAQALKKLKTELRLRHIDIEDLEEGDLGVYNNRGKGIRVVTDYVGGIVNVGRAVENNVWTYDIKLLESSRRMYTLLTSRPYTDCFKIDNYDNVILDGSYSESIDGRNLQTVIDSLFAKRTKDLCELVGSSFRKKYNDF